MAAPVNKSIVDLNGKWVMNKTLSDDTDALLAMQGVSWFTRKAIAWATITLSISQYTSSPDSLTHIDIDQTATGGLGGTSERRTLDWTFRDHDDHIFGALRGRARWLRLPQDEREIEDPYLRSGWLPEQEGRLVQAYVETRAEEGRWSAEQVWGFAEVEGKGRFHVRRVWARKGQEEHRVRLVYDWKGD